MQGLILKDLLLVKNSLSLVYLFPLMVILICGSSNLEILAMIISFFVPMLFGFFVYNTMYADENSQWRRFEKGLPIKTSAVVLSKYALGGIMIGAGLIADAFIGAIFVLLTNINALQMVTLISLGCAFGLVYISILIPSVLRFGMAKGPVVFIGFIALLTLVPMAMNKVGIHIDSSLLLSHPAVLIGCSMAVCLIFVSASYALALKIGSSHR